MPQLQSVQYDLFIVYASADQGWVEGYLLPSLNLPNNRIRRASDFTLGAPLTDEYQSAVTESRYTLLILSPAYLADTWGGFGAALSTHLSVEEQERRIIPLNLKFCQPGLSIRYLVSLDCTDAENWSTEIARLRALLHQPIVTPASVACPYPGMVAFREDDSAHFYGRAAEIKELIECLRLHPFLAVIGPSGSGKSSLVQAGLLPALRKSSFFGQVDWLPIIVRPGATPYTNLQKAIDAHLNLATGERRANNDQRLCLIIDQFEEVFSLSFEQIEDGINEEVTHFFHSLLRLIGQPNLYVVLTLRDDFYAKIMSSPLRDPFKGHHVDIPPLRGAGLRQAIARPAQDVGVYIEETLVERLLSESSDQPGALPFIQETLVLLWDRLERRYLPVRAYETLVSEHDREKGPANRSLSGIQIAMARRANAALAELAEPTDKLIAQRIFMRLVQFGEGRDDTRRQQTVNELSASGDASIDVDRVLSHLIQCRLLTSSGDAINGEQRIDIAHEKLIEGWPMLQGWIKELKVAEQTRRRLEAKAVEYKHLDGKGGLLDIVELTEAEEWLKTPAVDVIAYSEDLLGLIKKSQIAVNPGWHRWGTVGLITGLVTTIMFFGWIYYYLQFLSPPQSSLNSTALLIMFLLTVTLVTAFILSRRSNLHVMQKVSQFIGRQLSLQISIGVVLIGTVILWITIGSMIQQTEKKCNMLGYMKSNILNLAIDRGNVDPAGAQLFSLTLMRIAGNQLFAHLIDDSLPEEMINCQNFINYRVILHKTGSSSSQNIMYSSEKINPRSNEKPQLTLLMPTEDQCGLFSLLSYKFAKEQIDPTIDIDEELALPAPKYCPPLIANEDGYRFMQQRQYAAAEKEFRKATEHQETIDYAVARNNLGWALYEQGKYDEAIIELKRAIALSDSSYADFFTELATAYYFKGDYADAESANLKAISLHPKTLFANHNLAHTYIEWGKCNQASDALKQVKTLIMNVSIKNQASEEHVFYKNQGLWALRCGNLEQAIAAFEMADAKGTIFREEIIYHLALVFEQQGDQVKACNYWNRYQKLSTSYLFHEQERRKVANDHIIICS